MRRHRLVGGVGIVGLALALTACSSESGGAPPLGAAPSAPASSAAPPGSSTPAASDQASAPAAASGVTLKIAGARDKVKAAQTYKARLTVETDGERVSSGEVQVRLGSTPVTRLVTNSTGALHAKAGLPVPRPEDLRSELLVLPTVTYSSVSPGMRSMYDGKSWTRMPYDNTKAPPAQDFATALTLLQKSGDIREVGQETIDGKPTTHFSGSYSMILLLDNSGAKLGMSEKEYTAARKFYELMGLDKTEIELWVGADVLPVRQIQTTHTKAPNGKTGTTKTTMEFHDWGKPINDTPPPADQVLDIDPNTVPTLIPPSDPNRTPAVTPASTP